MSQTDYIESWVTYQNSRVLCRKVFGIELDCWLLPGGGRVVVNLRQRERERERPFCMETTGFQCFYLSLYTPH